jgi:hypothetical protein
MDNKAMKQTTHERLGKTMTEKDILIKMYKRIGANVTECDDGSLEITCNGEMIDVGFTTSTLISFHGDGAVREISVLS